MDPVLALVSTLLAAPVAAQDAPASLGPAAAKANGPAFAAPALIVGVDGPINSEKNLLFPTPVLFDVDRDGATELVVGDLWGSLYIYERVRDEDGAADWSTGTALTYADGVNVELPNW